MSETTLRLQLWKMVAVPILEFAGEFGFLAGLHGVLREVVGVGILARDHLP